MKQKFLLYLGLAFSLVCCKEAQATLKYIKADATGLNNGTSWANAYTTMQAIGYADTLWIAAGTYKPTTGTDRNATFNFRGKKVFGGFAGTETLLSQRDFNSNLTILSGDIGIPNDTSDNSMTLVAEMVNATPMEMLVDGIVFEKANGYAPISLRSVSNLPLNATFNNCRFRDNYGQKAGVLAAYSFVVTTFDNCFFEHNTAGNTGGVIYSGGAVFIIRNSLFEGNSADSGGVFFFISDNYTLQVDRSVFTNNKARIGGVYYNANSSSWNSDIIKASFTNSLFAGNTADTGSVLFNTSANAAKMTLFNCTVVGNKSADGTAINIFSASRIVNSIIWDNVDSTNTPAAQQVVLSSSGVFENSIFNNIIQSDTPITGNFNANPLFLAPAAASTFPLVLSAYNYRLSALSPAVDLSIDSLITDAFDLDSNNRIAGVHADLGCYETPGCSSAITGTITATNDTLFCPQSPILLTAPDGTAGFNWSNGANTDTTSIFAAGTYTLDVADTQNCTAHFTIDIIDATPNAVITQNGNDLTTGVFASYQWMKEEPAGSGIYVDIPGSNMQNYTPVGAGSYKVRVTTTAVCTDTSDAYAFPSLGINDLQTRELVRIYPNPAKDQLHAAIAATGSVTYTISNVMGKTVANGSAAHTAADLIIKLPAQLADGVYFLQLQANKRTYLAKFVLQR